MKKRTALIFLIAGLLGAMESDMVLDHAKVFNKRQRAPVAFPHELHMSADTLSCKSCHHNVKDEGELEEGGVDCSACHAHMKPKKLENAFHRQCIRCHTGYRKAAKKSGPETCGECHPKARKGK